MSRKPFGIQIKSKNPKAWCMKDWARWKWYRTRKSRDEALKTLNCNRYGGLFMFRPIDRLATDSAGH